MLHRKRDMARLVRWRVGSFEQLSSEVLYVAETPNRSPRTSWRGAIDLQPASSLSVASAFGARAMGF